MITAKLRRPRSRATIASGLLALFVFSGCYTFTPVPTPAPDEPPVGDHVRVWLAAPAAQRLSDRMGQSIRRVEGTVLLPPPVDGSTNPETLRLEVGWGAIYAGTALEGRRDTLTLGGADLLQIEQREISWTRSALVGLAGTVLAVLLLGAFTGGDSGGGPPGDDPNPPF